MRFNSASLLIKSGVLATLLITLNSNAIAAGAAKVERAQRGISAPLLDQGDYYQHPDGRQIKFYRKKDVYAIERRPSSTQLRSKSVTTEARFKAQFGNRVTMVKGHELGATSVVRIDNRLKSKSAFAITPTMMKSLDSSIESLQPVLANARGSGDILVTSKLIIKLSDTTQNPSEDLNAVLARFSLSLDRRLNAPGFMYSVHSNSSNDVSSRFTLVRQVMNDARVDWAQPQFKTRAYKTAFEPNDTLFDEQWHLRNTGKGGSRCDTDCDADNAWDIGDANGVGAVTGANTIIAIIDDGVQLDHEDLTIWTNPNPTESITVDGCFNDLHGCDFVDDNGTTDRFLNDLADEFECRDLIESNIGDLTIVDSNNVACYCQDDDGTPGPDGDPSPQPDSSCIPFEPVPLEQDNHGTAVAGLAAAIGNNGRGVAGTAYSAEILPIRLISDFDNDPNDDLCARTVEAMTYAGRYADVINNSWTMPEGTCTALDDVIRRIVDGELVDDNDIAISHRANGSPVIFSAGNDASGWVKVTIPVSTGNHSYEWRFLRTDFPEFVDSFTEDDSVWLDDIEFPDDSVQRFESGFGDFTSGCSLNECIGCTEIDASECVNWEIYEAENGSDPSTNQNFSRSGNSATIDMSNRQCIYSYLNVIKDGPAGNISFWVWVSTDLQVDSDKFEFLIDGKEVLSYGDIARVVDNAVAYPANVTFDRDPGDDVVEGIAIAVGASDAGDLSGVSTQSLTTEERISYSQFGPTLDVLAPSSNQHLSIVTTDRYGSNASGYNLSRDIGGEANPGRYTDDFGGTSASAPIVAGIAAAMIASDPGNDITATEIETMLKGSADKIGRRGASAYDQDGNTRSNFYGHGRVNMFRALRLARGETDTDPGAGICSPESFSFSNLTDLLLPSFSPQPTEFCETQAPLVPDDSICVPIKSVNGRIAVICI